MPKKYKAFVNDKKVDVNKRNDKIKVANINLCLLSIFINKLLRNS